MALSVAHANGGIAYDTALAGYARDGGRGGEEGSRSTGYKGTRRLGAVTRTNNATIPPYSSLGSRCHLSLPFCHRDTLLCDVEDKETADGEQGRVLFDLYHIRKTGEPNG